MPAPAPTANGAAAAPAYAPLDEVRRTFRVRWYRSPIDPAVLRTLMQRSDLKGLAQVLGSLGVVAASGALTFLLFERQVWAGFAVALFLHGTMAGLYGSANHELTHGTVFRTKWLGRMFLRVFALLNWFNPYDYALSHTYHHRYTLHPMGDREEVLPHAPAFRILYVLQLLTVNFTGGPHTGGMVPLLRMTLRTALGRPLARYAGTNTRKDKLEWMAAIYAGHPEERRRSVRWARAVLLFHGAVLAVAIVFGLWLLPVVISLAPFIANWWRYLTHLPMHCGLRTNVPDFRKCTRSIKLDPVSSLLYSHMNWHLEHHMYAGVPCYNLRKLNKVIAADLPERKSLFGAWREMRAIWRRQLTDPDYQYDMPLPPTANRLDESVPARGKPVRANGRGEELGASIGDLAPAVIAD